MAYLQSYQSDHLVSPKNKILRVNSVDLPMSGWIDLDRYVI